MSVPPAVIAFIIRTATTCSWDIIISLHVSICEQVSRDIFRVRVFIMSFDRFWNFSSKDSDKKKGQAKILEKIHDELRIGLYVFRKMNEVGRWVLGRCLGWKWEKRASRTKTTLYIDSWKLPSRGWSGSVGVSESSLLFLKDVVYFSLGFARTWKVPIHIHQLKHRYICHLTRRPRLSLAGVNLCDLIKEKLAVWHTLYKLAASFF